MASEGEIGKSCGREQSQPNLKYYPGTPLKGFREIRKYPSQSRLYSNWISPKHKKGTLQLQQPCPDGPVSQSNKYGFRMHMGSPLTAARYAGHVYGVGAAIVTALLC
jgi:hypothetical protein